MPYLWGPVINVSIFIVRHFYGKLALLFHILVGLISVIFTFASSIPINRSADVDSMSVKYLETYVNNITIHYRIGIACIFILGFEVIIGVSNRIMNMIGGRSILIIRLKKLHKLLGYIILILCKTNIYVISFNKYYGIFIQDCFFVVLFILWKIFAPRMSAKITLPNNN